MISCPSPSKLVSLLSYLKPKDIAPLKNSVTNALGEYFGKHSLWNMTLNGHYKGIF